MSEEAARLKGRDTGLRAGQCGPHLDDSITQITISPCLRSAVLDKITSQAYQLWIRLQKGLDTGAARLAFEAFQEWKQSRDAAPRTRRRSLQLEPTLAQTIVQLRKLAHETPHRIRSREPDGTNMEYRRSC